MLTDKEIQIGEPDQRRWTNSSRLLRVPDKLDRKRAKNGTTAFTLIENTH